MIEIIPSILVKTAEEFKEHLKLVAPHVSRVQWDIMDGKFVDNVTFSDPSVLDDLFSRPTTHDSAISIEVDLMVSDPVVWIDRFRHPGVDQLIFHVESANSWEPIFEQTRTAGFKVGLAAEPETPLEKFKELLEKVDRYQAMGGRSGFGGQEFNPAVLETIKKVRGEFPNLPISVDIGVNDQTAPKMIAAGATILVAGSYIFESPDPAKAIRLLEQAGN